jgi:hypothetical protein
MAVSLLPASVPPARTAAGAQPSWALGVLYAPDAVVLAVLGAGQVFDFVQWNTCEDCSGAGLRVGSAPPHLLYAGGPYGSGHMRPVWCTGAGEEGHNSCHCKCSRCDRFRLWRNAVTTYSAAAAAAGGCTAGSTGVTPIEPTVSGGVGVPGAAGLSVLASAAASVTLTPATATGSRSSVSRPLR